MTKNLITRRELMTAVIAALAVPVTAHASVEPYSWYGIPFRSPLEHGRLRVATSMETI